MKIAVFHNLPSGGALKALSQKIRLWKKRGHKIFLYTFSTSDRNFVIFENLCDSYQVLPLDFESIGGVGGYHRQMRAIAEMINASGADLAWIEKCRYFGSPPLLGFLKKPFIFYTQEPLRISAYEALAESAPGALSSFFSWPSMAWIGKFKKACRHFHVKHQDRKAIQAVHRLWTNSWYTRRWLQRVYGVDARVVYQGVDAEFFRPDSTVERESVVLSVGRLDSKKGHHFLIGVLSRIPKINRPQLAIAHDTFEASYQRYLLGEAKRHEVKIKFFYRISEEELRTQYQRTSLVLCPAIHEPFGLVPLEAMACATPVLAVNEGGFKETVVDGKTGFLLPRDPEVWARKIQEFFQDSLAKRKLGEAARAHILEKWTWDSFLCQFEKEAGISTEALHA
jgi:glycosyltransferase involved in cell wall biosynthesis